MSDVGFGPDERTNFRRKVILSVCLFFAVLLSVSASLYRWRNGVDAQNHAVHAMFSVVNNYVKEHDGAWPESWEVLEAIPETGQWYEPLDYDLIKKNVVIDFEASASELAKQESAEFHAIDAINPVFDFSKDPRVVELLATLKKHHLKKQE